MQIKTHHKVETSFHDPSRAIFLFRLLAESRMEWRGPTGANEKKAVHVDNGRKECPLEREDRLTQDFLCCRRTEPKERRRVRKTKRQRSKR